MAAPYFVQTLVAQKLNGALFNTYTTAKSVLNQTELLQIPGGYLQIGSTLRIRVFAGLSNIVTTPGTVTFQSMLGPSGTIVAWTSGTIQMSTTANTLLPINLELYLRLQTAGTITSAAWLGGGTLTGLNVQLGSGVANGSVTDSALMVPATSPAVGTGFDSTVTNLLDFYVGFSTSNAGNGIQIYNYTVEQLQ